VIGYIAYYRPKFSSIADPFYSTGLPVERLVRVPEYPDAPGDGDFGDPPFIASEMGVQAVAPLPAAGRNSVIFLESKLPKYVVFNPDCYKRGGFYTFPFKLYYMIDTALDCGASSSVVVGVMRKTVLYSSPGDPKYAAYLLADLLSSKPKNLPPFLRPYDIAVEMMFSLADSYGLERLTYACFAMRLFEPEKAAAPTPELAALALMCGSKKACVEGAPPSSPPYSLLNIGRCQGGEEVKVQADGIPDYDGRELLIYLGKLGPFLDPNYEKYYGPGGVTLLLHKPSDVYIADCNCKKK
jgi:hypothetical protein